MLPNLSSGDNPTNVVPHSPALHQAIIPMGLPQKCHQYVRKNKTLCSLKNKSRVTGKKKKKIMYIFKTGSPGVVWRYVLNMVAKQPVFFESTSWLGANCTLPSPQRTEGHLLYATYPKGIALHATPRIPRACSSALVPVGFKVNVPTGEKKTNHIFSQNRTAYYAPG